MDDEDFAHLSEVAYSYTGIVLGDHKRDMLYGRLVRRLRELGVGGFKEYREIVAQKGHPEISQFINAITTNLTSFFREAHHFDFLAQTVCPELVKRGSRRIRAWSAGCSTGEETYSIAITLKESLNLPSLDCKILATDLDSKVLEKGRQGVYGVERIENIGNERKKKWFLNDRNHPDIVKVKPVLQEVIRFKRLNLLESWPMKGPFDFIFCRNVMIYFDIETQRRLVDRYADILDVGGYLFIGHSESLNRVSDRFEAIGKTVYRKRM